MTSAISVTGNLPTPFTSFVGRQREVAEVRRRLGTARLLTLTGTAGVGKTRLALEVVAASSKAFVGGVWVVDLAPVREQSAVAGAAATALGVPDLGVRPVLDRLAAHLAGRRALIVLDNCEHLVDACAELAQTLLLAAPELRILATSRQTLGITGEHIFAVPPLPPEEAAELLRERATALQPEFQITDANRAQVTRLCADLDGLPLAIELAAARLRTLTVEQAADRLEDRFTLLTGGSRTALPRQRTLRAAIDWSYELCSPAERLLWNRLSVFTGSFGLEAAECVCSDEGIAAHEVLDLLDRLISQSVVLTTQAEGLPRYRLLETIRQYGRERLANSGQQERLRLLHRDLYLRLAEHIADRWHGPGQDKALARMRAEHANLLAALDCPGDPQVTLALAAALRYHWCVGGFLGEGHRRLDQALAAAPEPTPARADALLTAGWVAILQGDHAAADQRLDEAYELGGPLVRARVQGFRGTLAMFREQMLEALSLFEEAVAAHTTLGTGSETVLTLVQLAGLQARLGDPRAAETSSHALATADAHGDRWGRAHALWGLGVDAYVRSELAAAMELTRAALEIERDFTDYVGAVLMLEQLASLTASCGDPERAARQLGTAHALWRDIGTSLSAFPQLAESHARCEEELLRVLGPAAYEKAFADGSAADGPAQAIAIALGTDALGTGTGPETTAPTAAPSSLTRREREVAALVAQGMTNRQIGAELTLSPRTVDSHIENIRAKLGFSRRTQIAAWWAENQVPTQ